MKNRSWWPFIALLIATLIAFYPSILERKIPLNGNNLVSFFSPWTYEKWDGYPAGVPAKPGILDQIRIYYPYMRLTQESYRSGQLPLWNPYNFTGNPHMAEWQSGALYPLHILLPFLPLPVYWTIYQMVGIFLAGLFTYGYLRNIQLARVPSLLGGITYGLCSFMFTWNAEVVTTPHSILWLPAMLWAIDRLLVYRQWRYWGALTGSGVLSILSGYWQTTFYALITAGLYILIRFFIFPPESAPKHSYKTLLVALIAFPLMAGLTAYHLLPTAELFSRSSRADINWSPEILTIHKGYLLKPYWLITLIAPDFFGHPTTRNQFSESNGSYYEWAIFTGTIAILILPFITLCTKRSHLKIFYLFLVWGLIAGSFSFDLPHSRWVFDAHIPVLSTGIANRVLYIPAFSLAIMASIALNAWQEASDKSRRTLSFITAGTWLLFLLGLWIFLIKIAPYLKYNELRFPQNWFKVSLRNSILPTLVILFTIVVVVSASLRKKWVYWASLLIVIGAVAQNLYQFHKFTPFTEPRFVYPTHPTLTFLQNDAGINRFMGYNGVFLQYNYATQFKIYTIEGYDSLNDSRRTHLYAAAQRAGDLSQPIHRSADVVLDSNLANPDILRILQLTGTKYFVDHPTYPDVLDKASKPTLPIGKQKLVFNSGDWNIYEYTDALPRAFLAGNYIVESNDQSAVKKLFDPSVDIRQTVILSQEPQLKPEPDPTATIDVISYTPNKIKFKVKANKNQLLFLSDTYYPGWQAKIDGQKSPVIAADFAFRAIAIPKGEHSVEMYYLPESFTTGLKIAALTFFAMLAIPKVVLLSTKLA